VGEEIARLNRQIKELSPALLAQPRDVQSDQDAVKVGARELDGAVYVIAVNSRLGTREAAIRVPGLGTRTFTVLDEGREIVGSEDVIADTFAPLAVHVYVAAPPGWR
jgi:hypothetical protein